MNKLRPNTNGTRIATPSTAPMPGEERPALSEQSRAAPQRSSQATSQDDFGVLSSARDTSADVALAGVVGQTPYKVERQHQASDVLRLQMGDFSTIDTSITPKETGRGQSTQSPADRLYNAMRGFGTNDKEILRVLSGRSQAEIDAIRTDFRAQYGESLDSMLQGELSGRTLHTVELLLQGEAVAPAARDASLLALAMQGLGTDEKAILDVLYATSTGERDAIKAEYQANMGRDLQRDIQKETSGAVQVYALAMLLRGTLHPADRLRAAMVGLGTDEKAIFKALEDLSPEARSETLLRYHEWYSRDLPRDLTSELSKADATRALIMLARGEVTGADELHIAMASQGTDEEAIYKVFKGTPDEERAAIIADYNERYGDLTSDLEAELSGSLLAEVTSLMARGKLSPAEKLNRAMRGFGTDEEALFETLDDLNADTLSATKAEYQERYGRSLESHLRRELQGTSQDKALLIAEQGSLDLADKIHFAAAGVGTDKEAIFKALEKASPEERTQLEAAFLDKYGTSLGSHLSSALSGVDLQRATLLHQQGELRLEQALALAMTGIGTRETEIFDALEKASPEERASLQQNVSLLEQMRTELGDTDLARALVLLDKGALSRLEQVHFAMAGRGTDEELLLNALKELAPEERMSFQIEYKAQYGKDLLDELKAELGKRDLWTAVDALAPAPTTLRERFDRTEVVSARERQSGSAIGNFSDAVLDLISHSGRDIDQVMREYKATIRDASIDASTDPSKLDKELETQEKTLKGLQKEYRKEKESVADAAASVATLSVASAAIVATGGLAALPAAAIVASSAATTRVATRHMLVGDAYDLAGVDGLTDLIKGAGEGLSLLAMGKAGDAVTSEIGKRVLAAQGKDITAKGLLQLGRAALGDKAATATLEMLEKATQKALKKAGSEFLKRTLFHELVGSALVGSVEKGVYAGTKALASNLTDDKLHDMEFADAVKRILDKTSASILKAAGREAISAPAFTLGEYLSDAVLDQLRLGIGTKLAKDQVFTDKELRKAGTRALGDQAEGTAEETIKAIGREKLIRKLGDDALKDSTTGKVIEGLLEDLISRGIESSISVPLQHLGDREVWEYGLSHALELLWQETATDATEGFNKSAAKDLLLTLARKTDLVEKGSVSEALLGSLVKRTISADVD